jgi:hypothetical protein
MSRESPVSDLQRWDVGQPIPASACAAMAAHPRFAAAVRTLATEFLLLS